MAMVRLDFIFAAPSGGGAAHARVPAGYHKGPDVNSGWIVGDPLSDSGVRACLGEDR